MSDICEVHQYKNAVKVGGIYHAIPYTKESCPHCRNNKLQYQIISLQEQNRIMREALEQIQARATDMDSSMNEIAHYAAEALHTINNNNQKGDN